MSAKYEYNKKYVKKYLNNFDELKIRVPRGVKELLKAHAERFDNGSVNAFINRAIDETMERDKRGQ